jgi:hypothetical protein
LPKYFRELHKRFLAGERSRLNLFVRAEPREAQAKFYGSILAASKKRALSPIIREAGDDPVKWRELFKKNLPKLKEFEADLSTRAAEFNTPKTIQSGLRYLEEKMKGKEPLTSGDIYKLKLIFQNVVIWEMIGSKPADLTAEQRIILGNSSSILTSYPYNYERKFATLYHLISTMGYMFDIRTNNLRRGLFDEFTRRMTQRAEKRHHAKPEAFVKKMQAALLELNVLFQKLNAIRRPSKK